MKALFKKYGVVFCLVGMGAIIFAASNEFTDFWTIKGRGTLKDTSIVFIDTNRDFNLYDGDIYQGLSGSRPSTSSKTYPGYLVPFYNASGASRTEGDILIASTTASTSGYAGVTTAVATTTVIGVCATTTADGAVGWMRTRGYALVKTTGTVSIGDLIVSTQVAGYGARLQPANTDLIGVVIGKAMSVGTAAGGNTLVLLKE